MCVGICTFAGRETFIGTYVYSNSNPVKKNKAVNIMVMNKSHRKKKGKRRDHVPLTAIAPGNRM